MRYDPMQRRGRGLVWAVACLALLTVVLLGLLVRAGVTNARCMHRLQDRVQQSYYDLVDRMDNVHADMGKLMIASTPESSIALLGEIARQTDEAAACLGQMPAGHPALADTLHFLNQTSDYARSLIHRAAHGLPLTRENLELLSELRAACCAVRGTVARIDPAALEWQEMPPDAWYAEDGLEDARYRPSVDYPSMVYDGPFSDGLEGMSALGLEGSPIGAAEAMERAAVFWGDVSRETLTLQQVDGGKIPGYAIASPKGDLFVTRLGGEILWYLDGRRGEGDVFLEDARCLEAAADHLRSLGFADMQPVWHQVFDDMMVVEFAPVADGTVLYPDLVKVRVRRTDGSLAALDSVEYWMHHRERDLDEPLVSREEARHVLSDQLQITESAACLIPTDGGGERLCWEFRAAFGEDMYLVYIDAMTGAEAEILLLVHTEGGDMVV